MDGALSARSFVQESETSQQTIASEMSEDSISAPVETIETSHTVAPFEVIQDMVQDVMQEPLKNSENFKDLNVLEYLYAKNNNTDLLSPMIEKFLQHYQFDKANQYLDVFIAKSQGFSDLELDPHQVIYARLHSATIGLDSATALDDVFLLVKQYVSLGLLTADDEMFYKGIVALWRYDYETATAAFGKVTGFRYKDFKSSYESALANYIKIKNPPVYYRDALVALTLLKNGYFSSAKRLALRAVKQNPGYILPYQVLAYTNFLMHNRESAKDYFLKLADFDADNTFLYKFLIGISYYRYGDYEQSVLYLNQVTDPRLQIDVQRYMLLSYIQLEDTTNMIRMWHSLLGEQDLQASDFSLFFDQMFFVPYRTGKPFDLYLDNPQLVDLYLGKCSTLLSGSQVDVCTYGKVWLQLAQQNLSSIGTEIVSLSQKYQQSHLYHLLGDYYAELKQTSLAKDAYAKALTICDNLSEQTIIQHKLMTID